MSNQKILQKYRDQIDRIDESLIKLLKKRFDLAKKIGEYKKEFGKDVVDSNRETEVLKKIKEFATKYNIHAPLVESVWKLVFKHSHKIEK